MRVVQFVGPSANLDDFKTGVQRSINCLPMIVEAQGEDAPLVLESAPGLSTAVYTFGSDVRGMYNADGRMFVVAGATLYEMDIAEAMVSRGTVGASVTHAAMVNGEGQLAIADGGELHVLNLNANTLAQVTSAGWLGSDNVAFMDGYFIFVDPDTEVFYISAIDDATTLDALEFSSADNQPDNIIAHTVIRREILLMGSRSIEVWINSGAADFPFARYQGTPIDVGIVGKHAFCNANGTLVWVGRTIEGGPYVYILDGYQPRRISTRTIEQALERSTDLSAATLWTYQAAGGEYVCLDAPGLLTTMVYDLSTKLWHERAEESAGAWIPSRIEHHCYFNGLHYVSGGTKLYKMSEAYTSLAGDELIRERTWPHLVGRDLEPQSFASLELRCTTGETPEGFITLEVSNDGGQVFNSPLIRSLGATGRRNHRVRWMPLGTCPAGGSRVFRVRCSSAVPLTMQAAVVT